MSNDVTRVERIRRVGPAGNEFWSSREFSQALGYNDYRNFDAVVAKARTACFNSGQRMEDHFGEITEMIEIGKGGQRPVKAVIWVARNSPPICSARLRLRTGFGANGQSARTTPTGRTARSGQRCGKQSKE